MKKYTPMNNLLLDRVVKLVSHKTAVDLGCGSGELVKQLHDRGFEVFGVDKKIPKGNFGFIEFDLEDLGVLHKQYLHEQYGLVTCKLVLPFIKNKPKFIQAVKKMLRKKGVAMFVVPVRYRGYTYDEHYKMISMDMNTVTKLLEKYFKVVLYNLSYRGENHCLATFVVK